MPSCAGCGHLASCPYSLIFETPVDAENFSVLRKYPNAPHPFVLVPPFDGRTGLPPGVTMNLGLTLISRGIEYLPHFIRGFEAMGESGNFGGRFRLNRIVSVVTNEAVYDGFTRRILKAPPLWRLPENSNPV